VRRHRLAANAHSNKQNEICGSADDARELHRPHHRKALRRFWATCDHSTRQPEQQGAFRAAPPGTNGWCARARELVRKARAAPAQPRLGHAGAAAPYIWRARGEAAAVRDRARCWTGLIRASGFRRLKRALTAAREALFLSALRCHLANFRTPTELSTLRHGRNTCKASPIASRVAASRIGRRSHAGAAQRAAAQPGGRGAGRRGA
jgi:hypothetical protein